MSQTTVSKAHVRHVREGNPNLGRCLSEYKANQIYKLWQDFSSFTLTFKVNCLTVAHSSSTLSTLIQVTILGWTVSMATRFLQRKYSQAFTY